MRVLILAVTGAAAFIGFQQGRQRTPEEEAKLAAMFAPVEVRPADIKIAIGQEVSKLKVALKKDGTAIRASAEALMKSDFDDRRDYIELNPSGFGLIVLHSLSRDEITGLRVLVFDPSRRHRNEPLFDAKSVTLHKDGTYSIRFGRPPAPRPTQGGPEPKSAPGKRGQQTGKLKR